MNPNEERREEFSIIIHVSEGLWERFVRVQLAGFPLFELDSEVEKVIDGLVTEIESIGKTNLEQLLCCRFRGEA